jgi:type IV pilus assembly protein PilA
MKGPIQEYRKERGTFPSNNAAAGVPEPNKLIGNYVTSVEVKDGAINVTFGNFVNKMVTGQIVTLQPIVVKGSPASPMSWRCGYRGVPAGMEPVGENRTNVNLQFLPSSCRG